MFIYFYRRQSKGFIDNIIVKYEGVDSSLAMTVYLVLIFGPRFETC